MTMVNKPNASAFERQAMKGRRILNDNIRRDYARLLEIIADKREPDFEEVEGLANKYRMYYDEKGTLKEAD